MFQLSTSSSLPDQFLSSPTQTFYSYYQILVIQFGDPSAFTAEAGLQGAQRTPFSPDVLEGYSTLNNA